MVSWNSSPFSSLIPFSCFSVLAAAKKAPFNRNNSPIAREQEEQPGQQKGQEQEEEAEEQAEEEEEDRVEANVKGAGGSFLFGSARFSLRSDS